MKLLVVTYGFWPEHFLLNEMCQALVERGNDVSVLTGVPNYPAGSFYPGYSWFKPLTEVWKGVKIFRAPNLPRGRKKGDKRALFVNYLSSCLSSSLLGPFLCREGYDAVFVYAASPITTTFPAWVIAKTRDIPLVIWLQDPWPETVVAASNLKSRRVLSLISRYVTWIYSQADLILIQSKSYREHVLAHKVDLNKVRFFPNSGSYITRPVKQTHELQKFKESLESEFSVVYAGNIGEAQDWETVLDAAQLLRNCAEITWTFIGEGSRRNWLIQEIGRRQLGDQTRVVDAIQKEDLDLVLCGASCCLVTLKDELILRNTIPSKVQYYLERGKPVIGCLCGSGAEIIVESGSGLVSSPGDAEALAASVKVLSRETGDKLKARGAAARAFYDANFDGDYRLDELTALILELSNAKREH